MAKSKLDADLSNVNPRFAAKVRALLARMRARGFKAKVLEGLRSQERARELAAKGTGIVKSMHVLGYAVDIGEDDKTPWVAAPGFFEALHEEALALGLSRVRRADGSWDLPHVQALPGSMDAKVWAAKPAQVDAWIAQRYA